MKAVSLTQSIQNAKDIDKIFTSFSKTFSLPASKINNKIFKHYYNFDIVGGFDARIRKVPANIELNSLQFTEKGLYKLNGVDLKNNKADIYKNYFLWKYPSISFLMTFLIILTNLIMVCLCGYIERKEMYKIKVI
jgi:hypothetical protein